MICDIPIYKSHVIKIVISQYQSYVLFTQKNKIKNRMCLAFVYFFLFLDVILSIDMSSIIKRKKIKVMQKFDCYVIEITQKETFIAISIYKLLVIKLVTTLAFSNINESPS